MASNDFVTAFISSAMLGAAESAQEFVPSLCNTAYGIGSTLWTSATQPVDAVNYLASASYEMGEQLVIHIQSLDTESLTAFKNKCVTELKSLYERFNELSNKEKGELIGYSIGKYGVDIFAGSAAIGAVSSLKNLKAANRLCNLEAMSTSASKEAMIVSATKHAAERQKFFKGAKIHWDKQNKHVPGKHNYKNGRSIFEHKDAQRLIDDFAGTGKPIQGRIPGNHDYREKVNFGEFIGYHIDSNQLVKTPTTWGEIRYSNTGVHIIPAYPE